jgi:hypothetical protein
VFLQVHALLVTPVVLLIKIEHPLIVYELHST